MSPPPHTHTHIPLSTHPTEAIIKAHEYKLRVRATRIERLKAALGEAEARAHTCQAAAFRSQMAALRQQELQEAHGALRWVGGRG
jgi:hypothetical protein